jgi:hypothetical protein
MKPDFSGEYVLNRAASTLSAAGAANVQSASLRITHNEPNFSCQGSFSFPDSKPVEWTFDLVATNEPESTEAEGVTLHWDGSALVFTSRSEAMTISFRYEFDAEGRLRLAEQLRGTDHDQDNLWMFDRR